VADAAAAETWLRYKHFAPTQAAWNELSRGPLSDAQRKVRPRFITDFYAYNTGIEVSKASYEDARKYGQRLYQQRGMFDTFGLHWVGDLALDCEVKTLAGGGELVLELIEGGRSFHCQFDLTSGAATLSAEGLADWHPQAPTSLKATGTHTVRFANVDDKLFLWIDGKLVKFDQPTSYTLEWQPPTDRDREPAAIGARKAHVQVRHLRLLRDIYYIADKARNPPSPGPVSDYDGMPMVDEENLPAFDDSGRKPFPKLRAVDFDLAADQFLMLGDNSPRSSDSRLWPTDHFVERELLVGKAMFIYWPDALDHVPGTNIWFPFFPNFGRMRFIR
jgi:signal peptidase I